MGFGLLGFLFSRSILFNIDLCSTDLSLRKLWAPLQQPFNLKFPCSQSLWELQNIFFQLGCSFSSVASSYMLLPSLQIHFQAPAIPFGSWRWCWWGSAPLLGLLLWDWDKLLRDKKQGFTFRCMWKITTRGKRFVGRPGPVLFRQQ